MIGINGNPFLGLDSYVDLNGFDGIHLDILKGIASAKPIAMHGYLIDEPVIEDKDKSLSKGVLPLMDAHLEYLKLPDDHPIKQTGENLKETYGYNTLATFLKYTYGAHDSLCHYSLWDFFPGWSNTNDRNYTDISKHFPSLVTWIDNALLGTVFEKIGRAYIITIDSLSVSFDHRDPLLDPDRPKPYIAEFIHIRPDLVRPFYVYDPDEKQKHYINSKVSWWNDADVHGGEICPVPSYAIRIDGTFTQEFSNNLQLKK